MISLTLTKLTQKPDRPVGAGPAQRITEGYTIAGQCAELPKCGSRFKVLRSERPGPNGTRVKSLGLFESSPVLNIVNDEVGLMVFETMNSTYRLQYTP